MSSNAMQFGSFPLPCFDTSAMPSALSTAPDMNNWFPGASEAAVTGDDHVGAPSLRRANVEGSWFPAANSNE